MTGHVDISEFARRLGSSSDQIIQQMQTLAKDGFLKKVGGGFAVTEKGKGILKATKIVPSNMRFDFYLAIGQPVGISAGSVKEFHDVASTVNTISLEFHLYRGDFENWFQTVIGDTGFADELAKLKKTNLKDEELRKAIVKAVELRYRF